MTALESFASRLAELESRLAALAVAGKVDQVDLMAARVKVRYGDEAVTRWIPWLAPAGAASGWRPPSVGEQVLLLSPCGDLGQAFAMAGIYSGRFPAPDTAADRAALAFEDDALIAYDAGTHHLSVLLPAGATMEIEARDGVSLAGDLAIDGNLSVSGDISATGDISDKRGSMEEMRQVYNGHQHIIPGPPPTTVPATLQKMN